MYIHVTRTKTKRNQNLYILHKSILCIYRYQSAVCKLCYIMFIRNPSPSIVNKQVSKMFVICFMLRFIHNASIQGESQQMILHFKSSRSKETYKHAKWFCSALSRMCNIAEKTKKQQVIALVQYFCNTKAMDKGIEEKLSILCKNVKRLIHK